MLRKVIARNYKSIAEVEVELEQFTVLIGPNGSGKSNFVDVLRFVRDALMIELDFAITQRVGIKSIRRWTPRRPVDVAIELEFAFQDGTKTIYGFELGSERGDEYFIKAEWCETNRPDGTSDGFTVCEGRPTRLPQMLPPRVPKLKHVKFLLFPFLGKTIAPQAWNFLRSMGFYHPLPYAIRSSAYIPPPIVPAPLLEGGENLPSVLRALEKNYPEAFNEICKNLRLLVPGLKSLRPLKSGERLKVEHGDEAETISRLEFWQESDGTLRILTLLTAMYHQPPLSMLVIEEPELTIYPEALSILVDLLIERSAYQQVLITTHSPDLLNCLPAETLRIVELERGTTKISPLTEDQKEVIAQKYFKMGDLLRIEGLRRELPKPAHPSLPSGEQ